MIKIENNKAVLKALCHAFEMEAEKIESYLAISENLGQSDPSLRETLEREVDEELEHACKLADRIKSLGGTVPSRARLKNSQHLPQLLINSSDVSTIIEGAVATEEVAISHYQHIGQLAKNQDTLTYKLAVELQADEERHRREFEGFLWGKSIENTSSKSSDRALAFEQSKVA